MQLYDVTDYVGGHLILFDDENTSNHRHVPGKSLLCVHISSKANLNAVRRGLRTIDQACSARTVAQRSDVCTQPRDACRVSVALCLLRAAHKWAVSALASEPTMGLEMIQSMLKPGQRATIILVGCFFLLRPAHVKPVLGWLHTLVQLAVHGTWA